MSGRAFPCLTALAAASALVTPLAGSAVAADSGPRETLARAAFRATTKAEALSELQQAQAQASSLVQHDPSSHEGRLQGAIALAYHAQLTRSLSEAKAAHAQFEQLAKDYPNDPEALVALASWHLTAVTNLGGFLARTVLGASKDAGLSDLNRAVALGRGRAMFPAYAAMLRIQLDPGDVAAARTLAQTAIGTPAPTPIDAELQRRATSLLVPLNAGNGQAAAQLAKRLMPLGQFT